jgi:RES domain-containing protein
LILWRAARRKYADLSGQGGLYNSGRWHSQGRPVVYTAEHPALALLEVRVNLDVSAELLPPDYVMLKIEAPQELAITPSEIDPSNGTAARKAGDTWLETADTPLLRVRSVLAPESYNVLINPLHPDARLVSVLELVPFSFDPRLFG